MELPPKFVERVLRDLGTAEGRALCGALDAPAPVSVRLNPAKTGTDRLRLFSKCSREAGGAGTPQAVSGASVFRASGSAAFSGTETPPGLPQLDVAGQVPLAPGAFTSLRGRSSPSTAISTPGPTTCRRRRRRRSDTCSAARRYAVRVCWTSAPLRAARRRSTPRSRGRRGWSSPTRSTAAAPPCWRTTSASGARATSW